MNTTRPEVSKYTEYENIANAIWDALPQWTGFIIAIDGRDHAGKSSLGRYLSWQLGMPCLELDTFRNLKKSIAEFYLDDLRRSIDSRLRRNRPFIIEGATVLKALNDLEYKPDYLVYIDHESEDLDKVDKSISNYFSSFNPKVKADYIYDRTI